MRLRLPCNVLQVRTVVWDFVDHTKKSIYMFYVFDLFFLTQFTIFTIISGSFIRRQIHIITKTKEKADLTPSVLF